mmetsp:Transcript_26718/g.75056  ORF Transcript_26718/g.75056 Transcript_26718/m.75056 type:complete len:460 (-) Transcript_26718:344-1723(-)|eukprot:CAMPEP_0117662868 /NCGR_PEP_ID=MMETSP0804-20121206/8280_1 /TAXON_ID=1074897 /ORGANISM="Tetraselmis astigmatica, Strain CCMP880" /LENGTH=459 /DNA_ID=CAMNT_0005469791 /DNA_START=219 /DNA_END=1598 /DNA_ORIENTATION=-
MAEGTKRGGLLSALKSYSESSRGHALRPPDELEYEVQQRTDALQAAGPSFLGKQSGDAPVVPCLFTPKPKTDSLKGMLMAEAKERALEDREDMILSNSQMDEVWDMLLQHSEESEFDDKRINYDDFLKVRKNFLEQYGSGISQLFRASTFMRFPRDHSGAISIDGYYQYLIKRNLQERTAIALARYDSDNDGLLTTEELEAWIAEQLAEGKILHLRHMDRYFVTQYKHICARKFVFFYGKRGKMRIRDILNGPVLAEWMEMTKPSGPSTSNWFSLKSADRLYKMFMDLDQNMTGSLSRSELWQYSRTMTPLFLSRVFEEHAGRCRSQGGPRSKGEMVFMEFLDFVLAWQNKNSPPSIAYFFTIYDLKKAGRITGVEIYIFLMEIYKMWVDHGYYAELSVGDVKDEIFDMVKPEDELAITLQELIDCKVGGTVTTMMADMRVFWEYDNRESLMQHDDEEQ